LAFDFEIESARMALQSIRERKLRSVLTVTGIIIGIAAIVSMVSIGDGTNQYIQEQFEQLGANKIIISSISFSGPPMGGEQLTESDIDLVKSVRGVEKAMPMLYTTTPVTYKDVTITTMIIALNSDEAMDLFEGSQFGIENGRWIRSGDKYVVVLGKLASEENFGQDIKVRDKLTIKEKQFEVIGVMTEIGNSQDDSQIYMTVEALRELVGTSDEIDAIYAQALDTSNVEDVSERIQQKLDNKYGEDTFTVMSTATLAGQVTSIMSAISIALGGIAGIALLVAGIGIANTMYMTILERTKEIGIMKAIGASGSDILKIFLTEAAIIGLIGGIIGVMLGTGISRTLGYVLELQGLPLKTVVTPELALFSAGFSLAVGVVSGYLPSRQAAQLDPIQALRYE
jgi:putative ABC transport system permease protein